MRVGVNGAAGRMGATVCAAVLGDPGLELVAAVDPQGAGETVPGSAGSGGVPAGSGDAPAGSGGVPAGSGGVPAGSGGVPAGSGGVPVGSGGVPAGTGVTIASSPEAFVEAGAEVVVDFTAAEAAMGLLRFCGERGLHAVSGTTGLGEKDVSELRDLFGSGAIGAGPNCIWAPNFAIGAVLMMKMAEIAAPYVEGAEIIELHHDKKVDAPSGTSIETARVIAAARTAAGAGALSGDPTKRETIAGTRGGVGDDSIRIHSVRLPGLVAHQEVIFGILGQSLSIRHDSYDRSSFMPGVLEAVRAVPGRPGLTVGLAAVIGL